MEITLEVCSCFVHVYSELSHDSGLVFQGYTYKCILFERER